MGEGGGRSLDAGERTSIVGGELLLDKGLDCSGALIFLRVMEQLSRAKMRFASLREPRPKWDMGAWHASCRRPGAHFIRRRQAFQSLRQLLGAHGLGRVGYAPFRKLAPSRLTS